MASFNKRKVINFIQYSKSCSHFRFSTILQSDRLACPRTGHAAVRKLVLAHFHRAPLALAPSPAPISRARLHVEQRARPRPVHNARASLCNIHYIIHFTFKSDLGAVIVIILQLSMLKLFTVNLYLYQDLRIIKLSFGTGK